MQTVPKRVALLPCNDLCFAFPVSVARSLSSFWEGHSRQHLLVEKKINPKDLEGLGIMGEFTSRVVRKEICVFIQAGSAASRNVCSRPPACCHPRGNVCMPSALPYPLGKWDLVFSSPAAGSNHGSIMTSRFYTLLYLWVCDRLEAPFLCP